VQQQAVTKQTKAGPMPQPRRIFHRRTRSTPAISSASIPESPPPVYQEFATTSGSTVHSSVRTKAPSTLRYAFILLKARPSADDIACLTLGKGVSASSCTPRPRLYSAGSRREREQAHTNGNRDEYNYQRAGYLEEIDSAETPPPPYTP
jgi:hypothetical protein